MAKKTLLIDGDEYLYQTTVACEVECDWGDDLWTLHTNLGDCKALLVKKLDAVMRDLKSTEIILTISDDANFRKEVLPTYKAQRKLVRKPLAYRALRDWAMQEYPHALYPKLEADDVLGILSTSMENTVVVSSDKDLKTIPGRLRQKDKTSTIHEAEADYWFLYQTLCGDITDGYKGCPGIGPKTADKLIQYDPENPEAFDAVAAWPRVVGAYIKAGLTEQDALQQARVARILRSSDWDEATQTVKLWTPK